MQSKYKGKGIYCLVSLVRVNKHLHQISNYLTFPLENSTALEHLNLNFQVTSQQVYGTKFFLSHFLSAALGSERSFLQKQAEYHKNNRFQTSQFTKLSNFLDPRSIHLLLYWQVVTDCWIENSLLHSLAGAARRGTPSRPLSREPGPYRARSDSVSCQREREILRPSRVRPGVGNGPVWAGHGVTGFVQAECPVSQNRECSDVISWTKHKTLSAPLII